MLSIKVPPLGESIVEATVSRWLKNEGDAVASGDTLVELETDKITVEVPAPRAGVLAKRSRTEGDVVKVDDELGEIDETATAAAGGAKSEAQPGHASNAASQSGGAVAASSGAVGGVATPPVSAASATAASGSAAPASAAPPAAAPSSTSAGVASPSGDGDVKSSPAARRVAVESGTDISAIAGTGRGGVVSKPDVLSHVAKDASPPASTPPRAPFMTSAPATSTEERETRQKMSTRRKRIAENLLQSQHSTAHLTTFNEIDMTAVNALRDRMRERVEKEQGVKLTFMPFFVKATCMALDAYPVINAQVDGDSIIYKHYVNMGIAVASDAGLVVPNVKDAHRKGIIEIGRDISTVAKRARNGKLTMDDLTGGTFTITNGGVFGSLVSTPIINYPQVGILGLHKTQDRPVAIDGKVEIRPMMYVALSYDHRIVEGQQAVLFLVRVKELIEDPAAMLIS
jgi:2-oxoglutarate dehydrogenase E2 component (dihydrolipoamide succinyltransferase)